MAKYCIRIVVESADTKPVECAGFKFEATADSKDIAWNIVDYLITEYRHRVAPARFSSPPHIKRDLPSKELLRRHNIVAKSGRLQVTIGPANS